VHFNPTAYHNEEIFLQWLEDVYQPYIAKNAYDKEESLMVMDAAAFYKTPAVIKFIYEAQPPMLTALIPPELTSIHIILGNPFTNSPFLVLLQVRGMKNEVFYIANDCCEPPFPYST
jgi:hypothetical protein